MMEMIVPQNLQRIVSSDPSSVITDILHEIARAVESIIKTAGFCPVDTGNLRAGHRAAVGSSMEAYILNAVRYWVYVVYGHRVVGPTTDAARRAFFAKLGSGWSRQQRPTGYAGYVPPNNFLMRALVTAFNGGYVKRIVDQKIAEFLSGPSASAPKRTFGSMGSGTGW